MHNKNVRRIKQSKEWVQGVGHWELQQVTLNVKFPPVVVWPSSSFELDRLLHT